MSSTTTHYFSHDADARHDPKIVCMMNIFGVEGYGIYWCIIEILREEDDFKYKINNKYWAEGLAGQCKTTSKKIKEFVKTCIEIELLQTDGEKYIWSDSLIKRMGKMVEIIENNKRAAKIRWKKYSKKKGSVKHEEVKEEKEEESKGNNYVPGKILFSLKRGKFVGIKEEDYQRWEKEYPFLDVRGIISNMEDYWIDHKEKAKAKGDTWRTVISNRLYYQAKSFEGDKSSDYIKESKEIREQADYEREQTKKKLEQIRNDNGNSISDPDAISGLIKDTLSGLKKNKKGE